MTQEYEKVDLGNVKGDNGLNGQDGVGIESITLVDSYDNEDYYEITYTNPNKPATRITVTNGESIDTDENLSTSSINPIQNKTVTNKFAQYYTKAEIDEMLGEITDYLNR